MSKQQKIRAALLIFFVWVLGMILILAPTVKAQPTESVDDIDMVLTRAQQDNASRYGYIYCSRFLRYKTEAALAGVVSSAMDDGFTGVEAAEIIGVSFVNGCPEAMAIVESLHSGRLT